MQIKEPFIYVGRHEQVSSPAPMHAARFIEHWASLCGCRLGPWEKTHDNRYVTVVLEGDTHALSRCLHQAARTARRSGSFWARLRAFFGLS